MEWFILYAQYEAGKEIVFEQFLTLLLFTLLFWKWRPIYEACYPTWHSYATSQPPLFSVVILLPTNSSSFVILVD